LAEGSPFSPAGLPELMASSQWKGRAIEHYTLCDGCGGSWCVSLEFFETSGLPHWFHLTGRLALLASASGSSTVVDKGTGKIDNEHQAG